MFHSKHVLHSFSYITFKILAIFKKRLNYLLQNPFLKTDRKRTSWSVLRGLAKSTVNCKMKNPTEPPVSISNQDVAYLLFNKVM